MVDSTRKKSLRAADRPQSLIVILGDQLSLNLVSLQAVSPESSHILMAEVSDEAVYVKHHKKKLVFILSAMRHFRDELTSLGWNVNYVSLDDPENTHSLPGEIERAAETGGYQSVSMVEPGEWRLHQLMVDTGETLRESGVSFHMLEDNRFLFTRKEFHTWSTGRKQLLMENFYREMRRKSGMLMDGDKPVEGKWNFDSDNRKSAKKGLTFPTPYHSDPNAITQEVQALVEERFADHFGHLHPFWFAVTRQDAEAAFEHFVETALPYFGDYQDAMLADQKFLFHSVIALYINTGLLDPVLVCQRVESEWQLGSVPINAAEGFIRQIIGWREFVRGIYWLKMPGYIEENFFDHREPLPEFYWSGETRLNCLHQAITQTRDEAYAHHIQRLMVTGNFAMLIGVDPVAVHEWYLAVYADAFEWVELPNTLGMSQFADGGFLATKPYASSGNYINKMSDYCKGCEYKISKKSGPEACPFNYLYWHFLARNEDKLGSNHRMARSYVTYSKFTDEKKSEIENDSVSFIKSITQSA